MSNPTLPDMHYLTEPERAKVHPAVVRTISIPSIPPNFPFNTPISEERRNRGPRFMIGWLEFQSTEQPDPEVARPGDVWIQLPSGHRKARVYACYTAEGKDWSPWAGNSVVLGGRSTIPMHPHLNDHAQRKFFLVFTGSEFTWANPKGVSIVWHNNPQIGSIGPAEAVIKWLKVTGVGRTSSAAIEEDNHSHSAPLNSRKHEHPDNTNGSPGHSASAPPAKKPRQSPSHQSLSAPDRPLAVKLGAYAKAGVTQQGWVMSVDNMPLHMPFPCINCTRTRSPCSGFPGERCGRCRFKRLACSHHTQKPREHTTASATEAPKPAAAAAAAESSSSSPVAQSQPGLMLRLPPLRPWVPAVTPADAARANKASRRVRIRSSSVAHSDNNDSNRSSSPLSSVHDLSDPVPPHSETAILDARDDAAVENLLDSASMMITASAAPAPDADAEGEGNATDKTPLPDEAGSDEDEEFVRFVQMTLDGMARAQEGLRGVFALTRRRLAVKRTAAPAAAPARQVAGVGEGAVTCATDGDHGH